MEEEIMSENIRRDRDGNVDITEALDHLTSIVQQSKSIPFSDNCVVNREDTLYWINHIRNCLPDEIMQARDMLAQNRQIVASARQKAERILLDTEQRSAIMVNEHEITLRAREHAQQVVDQAQQNAWRMRTAGVDYVRQHLDSLENQLTEMLITIQKNKKDLK